MEQSLTSVTWRLAALVALVFANGFFVAAEFAIVTVRKTRIDQLIAEGNRPARAVRRAVSAPDRYIAATQLGITMASLGLGWIGEPALAEIVQPSFAFLPAHVATATLCAVTTARRVGSATSAGSISPATAGSPSHPRPMLAIVMPSCVAAM